MKSDIFQRIENAKQPDFGDVLSKSFNLFQKVWLEGFIHLLIAMAILIPLVFMVYLPMMGWAITEGGFDAGGYDQYGYYRSQSEPPVGILILTGILYFAVILVAQALSYAIYAHFFHHMKKVDTNSNADIGGYFSFLKGPKLTKALGISVATLVISIVAAMLCLIPLFYVIVPLNLLAVIFAFHSDLSVSDMIKACFTLGNRFWLHFFGLMIVSSLIAQLGILACGIGLFFTASYVQVVLYYIYKDTIGLEEAPVKEAWDS